MAQGMERAWTDAEWQYSADLNLLSNLCRQPNKVELMYELALFMMRRDNIREREFERLMLPEADTELTQGFQAFPNTFEFVKEVYNDYVKNQNKRNAPF